MATGQVAMAGHLSVPHRGAPGEDAAVDTRTRARTPRLFRVLLHNDDFTTMDFVVGVLMRYFHKTETEANRIMLQVHHRGSAVAGVYPRDVAETKVSQATADARSEGFPLRLTSEPE